MQFVKQAAGSEVEHTVLCSQRVLGHSPSHLQGIRADVQTGSSQPALATSVAHSVLVWLVVVSTTGSAEMTLEAPKKLMIKSTMGEDFLVVYLTVGTIKLSWCAARRFSAQK